MNRLASLVSCTAPGWVTVAAILLVLLFVQLIILPRSSVKQYRLFLFVQVVALALSLWLGSYRFSPLYAKTKVLQGFDITLLYREKTRIQSGAIVSLGRNSIAAIAPITLPGDQPSCNWFSQQGGALDDATQCETIYAPPAAEYDILQVSVRSSCGLPNAVGQIKFSILP